ncbi:MAG: CvpA family protein [Planctomycetes bacterium]|nr:CvpA family protein [Planctomycetota bacterium]
MLPETESVSALPRWLDLFGFGLIVLFVVLGARRGLWWQLVRLLGLAAVIAVARALVPRLAPALGEALPELDPRIASGLVWLSILALGLALVALVGRLGKAAIEAAQLGLVDRAGGALAGALSGVLLHGLIVLLLVLLGPLEWARSAVQDTRSERLFDTLGRRLSLLEDVHASEALETR